MNKEIIKKIKSTNSSSELKELANKSGYSITDEEAKKYFDLFHNGGKIGEQELESVAGGKCWRRGSSKYSSHDHHYLIVTWGNSCSKYQEDTGRSGIPGTCHHCLHSWISQNDACTYCTKRSYYHDECKGDK